MSGVTLSLSLGWACFGSLLPPNMRNRQVKSTLGSTKSQALNVQRLTGTRAKWAVFENTELVRQLARIA
jgi:hypothetical protein